MDNSKLRVFGYSNMDQRLFVFKFGETELLKYVEVFTEDIWFFLTDDEINLHFSQPLEEKEYIHDSPVDMGIDNLKEDFIWFQPGINKRHIMQCTCEKFLESSNNMDKLAKLAVAHAKRTGHTLNPRGN